MTMPFVHIVTFAALLAAAPSAAQGWRVVDLRPESRFEYGCFEPCTCPVLARSIASGRMALFRGDVVVPGSPVLEYAVTDVSWKVGPEGNELGVLGSGTYRRNMETGEHQLALDLHVGGGPLQHYDSGLVPGPASDDVLDIDISLHGEFCFDSVFRVRGTFRTTDVPGGHTALAPRVYPNPFVGETEVAFTTASPGPVDVRVFDSAGRQVARLAAGWRPAGPVWLRWDGRGADGQRVPAGIYLVRVAAGGQRATRRVALVP